MANREEIMAKISELIGPFNNKGVDLSASTTFQGDLEWDGLTDIVVKGHAHIIVGTEENCLLAVADGDGWGKHFLHHQGKRILDAGRKEILALLDKRIKFAE